MARSQLNVLELVYRPISNQEAEWVKDDKEVWDRIRQSKLYMIGRRPEAFLQNLKASTETNVVTFDFEVEGIGSDPGELHIASDGDYVVPEHIELECGPKHIRLWETDAAGRQLDLFDWFNTERLLERRTRHPALRKLVRHREFARYELLYCGISKEDDAFMRLVKNPHEKRVEILSNEYPIGPGARVSDEVYFFFFRVAPLHIQIIDTDEELATIGEAPGSAAESLVVADAEKAFVHVLKSKYNRIKFQNYPEGRDGLYKAGLCRHR